MIDQRLVKYIKTEEGQGYTPMQLRSFLVSKGFAQTAVDEALVFAAQNNLHPKLGPAHVKKFSNTSEVKTIVTPDKPCPKGAIVVATLVSLGAYIFIFLGINLFLFDLQLIPLIESFLPFEIIGYVIIIAITFIVLGLGRIVVAWGLFTFKKWARIIGLVLACFNILSVVGLVFGVLMLVLLLQKNSKEAFQ